MLELDLDSIDAEQVRLLERRRIEATRANDADALAPLLHDRLIYVNSIGEIYDKQGYLNDIRSHCLSYGDDFDVQETEVRVLDDLIILVGMMIGHSRLEGEQQVFRFRSLGIWRKEEGRWSMIAWQSSAGNRGY